MLGVSRRYSGRGSVLLEAEIYDDRLATIETFTSRTVFRDPHDVPEHLEIWVPELEPRGCLPEGTFPVGM